MTLILPFSKTTTSTNTLSKFGIDAGTLSASYVDAFGTTLMTSITERRMIPILNLNISPHYVLSILDGYDQLVLDPRVSVIFSCPDDLSLCECQG